MISLISHWHSSYVSCLPKLHVSSTGAWAVIRIRFRRRAARCIGKIKGPKVSNNLGKLHAGWYADSLCPGGNSAAPSEAERFLPWVLILLDVARMDLYVVVAGESKGESGSGTGDRPCALLSSQKSSRISVFVVSKISSLFKVSRRTLSVGIYSITLLSP